MSKKSTTSSKPPQAKILLDTCSYFRLAQSIHPLLGQPFGEQKYALYIHPRLQAELNKSERLQSKFNWAEREEYKDNRRKIINPASKKEDVEFNFKFIENYQVRAGYNLSAEDIYCVATALSLNIPLVTDDISLRKVCEDFEVKAFGTIELLKLMYDCKYISTDKIIEIKDYLCYMNDWQANFDDDMKKYFNIDP